jgi:hypothetical protein
MLSTEIGSGFKNKISVVIYIITISFTFMNLRVSIAWYVITVDIRFLPGCRRGELFLHTCGT